MTDLPFVVERPAEMDQPSFRAGLIRLAFAAMSDNPSISGMTLMIPDDNRKGGIETVYLANPAANPRSGK